MALRAALRTLAAALIFAILAGQSAATAAKTRSLDWRRAWETLEAFVPRHIEQPKQRLKEIHEQKALVVAAFASPHTGIRIDVIINTHAGLGGETRDMRRETMESDKKTLAFLEKIGQDALGVEGFSCQQITEDCIVAEAIKYMQSHAGYTPSRRDVLLALAKTTSHGQPWAAYSKKHPTVPLTGLNDPIGLDELHLYLLQIDLGGAFELATLDVRTDIGVARMINFMAARRLKHGVVLFGSRHGKRASALLAHLNISSTAYIASKEW